MIFHTSRTTISRESLRRCSLSVVMSLGRLLCLIGCSALSVREEVIVQSRNATSEKPRHLFVFFDGTRNDAKSQTNIWELKKAIDNYEGNGQSIYVEGVGTIETPILGASLGFGMEPRILRGYSFLSKSYRAGDKIFIFGFSRGAHEARSLAGLIAYSGLLDTTDMSDIRILVEGNKVLEMVKDYSDEEMKQAFIQSSNVHPLAVQAQGRVKQRMRQAQIEFLGIWDTVPGSSFKEYGECSEKSDDRKGERYKTGSYPSIKRIMHAVALDEKRSKFSPILVCPAMRPDMTVVKEVWFSGAHADVGGGYQNGKLHLISLSWMASELAPHLDAPFPVPTPSTVVESMHWSIGDSPANLGSACEDRRLPATAQVHPTAVARRALSTAPIEVKGTIRQEGPNPPRCGNIAER